MALKNIIKGKWYLQDFTDAYTNIIRSNQGKGFKTILICDLHGSDKENRPTAKLISAAPEMYEALEAFVSNVEKWLETGEPADPKTSKAIYDKAKKALTAAKLCQ